jgi:uncharacterized Tic20 family protein
MFNLKLRHYWLASFLLMVFSVTYFPMGNDGGGALYIFSMMMLCLVLPIASILWVLRKCVADKAEKLRSQGKKYTPVRNFCLFIIVYSVVLVLLVGVFLHVQAVVAMGN